MELTYALGAELLVAVGKARDPAAARALLVEALESGRALNKFEQMIAAQGGEPEAPLHFAPLHEVVAERDGFVQSVRTETLGRAIARMGGGRAQVTDAIDHSVGLEMLARIGDRVERGQPLAAVYAHQRGYPEALAMIAGAIVVGPEPVEPPRLIVERIA